jgi:hypothetical protein
LERTRVLGHGLEHLLTLRQVHSNKFAGATERQYAMHSTFSKKSEVRGESAFHQPAARVGWYPEGGKNTLTRSSGNRHGVSPEK